MFNSAEYYLHKLARIAMFTPVMGSSHTSDSSLSAAKALAKPNNATMIRIQALAQNVRYTLDGTVPTSTYVFQLKAGDPPLTIWMEPGKQITIIQETSGGIVQYEWGN